MAKDKGAASDDRPTTLSRSAIEEFLECPRCFYMHRKLGFARPSGPMSGLPGAVDGLLKREFDRYRELGQPHPVMADLPGQLVPFAHDSMNDWRNNRKGVTFLHEPSGFVVSGAPDDIWESKETSELFVVDYKTTASKDGASLDTPWGQGYRRQVEIYQWLLRKNGFKVADTAYFLYETVDKTADGLGSMLRFTPEILSHEGTDTAWIDEALLGARACFDAEAAPPVTRDCAWCSWAADVN